MRASPVSAAVSARMSAVVLSTVVAPRAASSACIARPTAATQRRTGMGLTRAGIARLGTRRPEVDDEARPGGGLLDRDGLSRLLRRGLGGAVLESAANDAA